MCFIDDDALLNASAQNFLRANNTLHDLLKSGGGVLDVHILDEFTHDVVALIPLDGRMKKVVFDST